MNRWRNHVAVVTGASSGIGAACAKLILAEGIQVVGLARRIQRLEQLKLSLPTAQQKLFHFKQCDVSQEQQVNEAFDWIEQTLGGTDILVNNAGILRDGNLVDMSISDIRDVVNTNLMGSIYCLQNAIKSMRKRNYPGHLIFINSTAGLAGYNPGKDDPSLNVYTPTKFALNAVNEICRQELITLKTKVKTTNISPGWVSTEIVPDETKAQLGDVILHADDIANAVIYALSTPPHAQVQEITLRAVGEWF
ncbi:farnesol dehydrogenase [Anastrepha ludens]|uniref:farnesol dehydrogenase n=1 Tax=Anastrepha ludens TaxID=28586 RepID=UPI0023AF96FC|nr:farnesol dehydrogenase [Anastrepha ludens]XP_053948401.1 farnesol dehydrogenase [Anastrepha ludens]XP_053948402.1 farnesol dehydrogenase [Anastrepha ludens]